RRQHQLGRHVLDFYCAEARYNLELDGSWHGFPEQQLKDAARDEYLKSRNIVTRRFWNSQLKDIRFIRDTIWTDLQSRASHPENVQPETRVRLPTRLKKSDNKIVLTPHPSPLPVEGRGGAFGKLNYSSNNARANCLASKGCRSSACSPRPMNLTGRPSSFWMA